MKVFDGQSAGVQLLLPRVIFEDRTGAIWVGTAAGVTRYEEERDRWVSFTKGTGDLNSAGVEFVGQSNDGRLWLAGGYTEVSPEPNLSCLDQKQWRKSEPANRSSILSLHISSMFTGSAGELWLTSDDQLFCIECVAWPPEMKLSKLLGDDSPIRIRFGLQDRDGDIWLATSVGIVRFCRRNSTWTVLNPAEGRWEGRTLSTYLRFMLAEGIYRIFEDRKGRLWFATSSGPPDLLVYDKRQDAWLHFNSQGHLSERLGKNTDTGLLVAYEDSGGRMMLGTKVGLLLFTESAQRWELYRTSDFGLPVGGVSAIFEDRNHRIWMAAADHVLLLEQ